jgi:hypothetical protein
MRSYFVVLAVAALATIDSAGTGWAQQPISLVCDGTAQWPGRSPANFSDVTLVLDLAQRQVSGLGNYHITEATPDHILFESPLVEEGRTITMSLFVIR